MRRRVDCVGMVGRYPTPKGMMMMYDTGRVISPVVMAEALTLQGFAFRAEGRVRKAALKVAYALASEIAKQANIWPVAGTEHAFVALAEDGRLFITEPFYEENTEEAH